MARREVWSFFTGAMGLDLGLELAGLPATLAVEIDQDCCATIRNNRPRLDIWETDISRLIPTDLFARRGNPREVFLMAAGPPCQSFSPGGKRAALSDPRGNLVYTYLKLINEVRPRYFIFENVANIVTAALKHRPISERPGKHWNLSVYEKKKIDGHDEAPMQPDELSGSAIRQVFADMSGLGYHLNLAVVDAADFGAAQHRLRFVMLGARNGSAPKIPSPTHGEFSPERIPYRTVRDAIHDIRQDPGPHSEYTSAVARFFVMVPEGGNWRHLPKELQPEAMGPSYEAGGGKTGFYRRLSWGEPSPTITGRSNRKGSAVCHPEFVRPLSVRECARLQGFPDDWEFVGSMSQQYQQVGNAVPVQLGIALGRAVLGHKDRTKKPHSQTGTDLERMLGAAVARLRASARNKKSRANEAPLFAAITGG